MSKFGQLIMREDARRDKIAGAPSRVHCSVAALLRNDSAKLPLALAGFVLLFWPAIAELFRYWMESPDFSHGLFVPLISFFILFSNRKELGELPASRSFLGLAVLAVSLAFFFVGRFTFTDSLQRFGLVGSLVGGLWFALGSAVIFAKPFPFFFLFFCVPPPFYHLSSFRLVLQGFVARLTAEILFLFGQPALAQGNVLTVGNAQLEVAEACSGIRSILVIITTAVLFAYVVRTGFWKGLALTLTAVPITICVNVLRLGVLAIVLAEFNVDPTQGPGEKLLGLVLFGLSLTLLYASYRFYDWVFRREPVGAQA